jgi:threonine dehydratase
VLAYSSGNHAQAVAIAAALLGSQATIVMPEDAPAAKLDATRGYGAEIITYDRWTESREELGAQLAEARARARQAVRRPARHDRAGTVALELLAEAPGSTSSSCPSAAAG